MHLHAGLLREGRAGLVGGHLRAGLLGELRAGLALGAMDLHVMSTHITCMPVSSTHPVSLLAACSIGIRASSTWMKPIACSSSSCRV